MKPLTKLQKSAQGEECTINIAGWCRYDPATTVLCHVEFGQKGKNCKDDLSAVYGCDKCHDAIDRRVWPESLTEKYRMFYIARALVRTHKRMLEKGLAEEMEKSL